MLQQEIFFRRFGARLPNHLLKPNIFSIDKFEFPKNSIWNYIQYDGINNGPDTNDYYLRSITRKIFVEHVLQLNSEVGNPRRLGVPLMPYVRQFHTQNKRFRLSMDIAVNPSDENTLGILSYCLLLKAYRYPRSIYSEYYKWKNLESTVWDKIAHVATVSQRKQYYFAHLPTTLPSIQRLNLASEKFTQVTLNIFNSKESLFLLEFWKWLSVEWRHQSVLGQLTQEQLNNVNIVFEDNGHWMLFNLGLINQWRYIEGESDPKQKYQIDPLQIQKRMLRAMMLLMSYRTTQAPTDETSDNVENTEREMGNISYDSGEEQVEDTSIQEYNKMLDNLDDDLNQLDVIEQETTNLIKAEDDEIIDDHIVPEIPELVKEEAEEKPVLSKAALAEKKKTLKAPTESIEPDSDVEVAKFETNVAVTDAVKDRINNLADDGLIDGSEYRKKMKLLERYETLESPETGVKLVDYVKIDPKSLELSEESQEVTIVDHGNIPDKSMLKSSLLVFDKKYIEEVMQKDIVGMALATQKSGFIIIDYEVEKTETAIGAYNVHTMRVSPVEGQPSTLRFRLPVVNSSGHFEIGGTRYLMQKQRAENPIRKISPTRVALTSYYGKTFVIRSEKKSNDYALWLHNQISALSFQNESGITDLHPSNVFDNEVKAPRAYSSLSFYLKSFKYKGYELNFDYKEQTRMFSAEELEKYNKGGSILFGNRADGALLLMDKNSTIYEVKEDGLHPLGTIENFLNIDTSNAPIEFAESRIFSKNIPVGVVLAYKLGLSNLIEMLKPEMRSVPVGQRLNLQSHEYAIVFSDETLIFSKEDTVASMILSGFKVFEKTTKNYSVHTFNKTGVYLKLLEQQNLGVRYLREIDLLDEMFVDPITKEVLQGMGEPLTYRGLLVRSCELLMTDYHSDPLDMQEMRIKGYERMSGAVYAEIVNALREHRSKPNKRSSTIDLNPYAVWKRITQDPSVLPVNDLNPIQNLKETEAVTYGGVGGRSSRVMVKSSRAFHENDAGVISEATRDSSDVAINTSLVANPKFTSLRGTTKRTPLTELKPSSLVSTSALLSVAGDQDSAQRLNMVSIQQSHSIACNGYEPSFVRTGYESVIAQRVGSSFACAAKLKGKVVSSDDKGLVVEYEDGTKEGFALGVVYGKSSDLTIPHVLVSSLKVGDRFNKGDVLSYNNGFFEKDRFNPKSVIWKNSVLARVALMESRQTHEDASSISRKLASELQTRTTKIKNVVVTFDQHIRGMLDVGAIVDNDTVLCYIEDNITASGKLFDDDTLNTLKNLSQQAPLAKVNGRIDKIEVFYNGDLEDMSDTLRAITQQSDKQMRQTARSQNKKVFNGSVDESFRIDGEPLQLDSLVVRFYISSMVSASVGDKGVFANQLKTIFSEVMDYDVRTESGLEIDAIFGAQSIFNRIVNSAFVMGTTNTLLGVIGKKAAKIYNGQ